MGVRDKLKQKFGGSKKSGENSPSGESTPVDDFPKPKYRGKVDKEHHDKLHAFSFSDAFGSVRRESGTCSPRGTTAQSRRSSWISRRSKSDRHGSSASDVDSKSLRRRSVVPQPQKLGGNEVNDFDVANAGLSRQQTTIAAAATANGDAATTTTTEPLDKALSNGTAKYAPTNNIPFAAEELEKAMTVATLKPPRDDIVLPQEQAVA